MVIRRTGFSPIFRYSCLHSHSCNFHGLVSLGVLTPAAIDSELARDNTAGGQRQAASAKAGIPTAAAKLEAWNAVVENDGLANALLEATVGGFSQPDQRELL